MRSTLPVAAGYLGILLAARGETAVPVDYRLSIADCDDVDFGPQGPQGDIYFGGGSYDATLRVGVDREGFAYATGRTKSHEAAEAPMEAAEAPMEMVWIWMEAATSTSVE